MAITVEKNEFSYTVGSNVILISGVTKYLSKILWEEGKTYEDVKEFICK